MAEHRAGFGRHDILLLSLSLLIAAGIFVLDLLIPLGVAAGVPYIAVVFLGAWLPWRHSIILLAAIGTTLTVLGYQFSAPEGIVWMVDLNRGLALFAIWVTAFLLTQRRGAEEALKAARDRLEKANADLQGLIAERKQAEEKVKASLAEKEVLLREIHHRVKNNLQVISSMLSLQARTETDERSIKALQDSQRRVKVIARIHESLHQSDDLASINARDYLNTLIECTIASSEQDPQRISCRLDMDEDDIVFDVDQALACGQIVSELLSNSLKHAFPNGRSGNIVISLHRRDGGRIELTVADDGEGLPENFDLEQPETLGIRLVHALVMQLNGAANVDGSVGTRVQITFPKNRS